MSDMTVKVPQSKYDDLIRAEGMLSTIRAIIHEDKMPSYDVELILRSLTVHYPQDQRREDQGQGPRSDTRRAAQ